MLVNSGYRVRTPLSKVNSRLSAEQSERKADTLPGPDQPTSAKYYDLLSLLLRSNYCFFMVHEDDDDLQPTSDADTVRRRSISTHRSRSSPSAVDRPLFVSSWDISISALGRYVNLCIATLSGRPTCRTTTTLPKVERTFILTAMHNVGVTGYRCAPIGSSRD
jgi:hypothetical protein